MLLTVLRAGAVLSLFDAAHPERTLSEVAEALELPRSTVHALLKTLCAAGLLRRTPSRRYALGTRLHALSAELLATEPGLANAGKLVEDLAATWGGVARLLAVDPAWGLVEVPRAEAADADRRVRVTPHRCQAVADAVAAGEGAQGCWTDVEVTQPGWCCVAAVLRGTSGALVLELTLPATRFYGHAAAVRASVLSACGYRLAQVIPLVPCQASARRTQLAR
ncbi:MAG: helix-turn-helix domain-containing protein [Armatimonadota bacterium]|nr:helix-turn-helix domain-containing protein [Armatimonadota bacterium]